VNQHEPLLLADFEVQLARMARPGQPLESFPVVLESGEDRGRFDSIVPMEALDSGSARSVGRSRRLDAE
jgi:hypothetical protein